MHFVPCGEYELTYESLSITLSGNIFLDKANKSMITGSHADSLLAVARSQQPAASSQQVIYLMLEVWRAKDSS